MKFKVVGKRGDLPFMVPSDKIESCITSKDQHSSFEVGEVAFLEYVYNEAGDQIVGIKCLADLGHGYGFDNGWEEFVIKAGETYSFRHSYTSIEGPSDWSSGSFTVTLQLVEEA